MTSDFSEHVSVSKSFLAGGCGGICLVITGHPFDTIKVRLQTMPPVECGEKPVYHGAIDCTRKTILKEGIGGLYKGMIAPLLGAVPIFALFFFGYSFGTNFFARDPKRPRKHEIFCAGMLSGVFTGFVSGPGERIKCLLQVQDAYQKPKYTGAVDAVVQLLHEGGLRNIFKGTGVTLLRDIPASGVYFLSYQCIKDVLRSKSDAKVKLSVSQTLLAGGIAGICSWLVAIPADVIKSRLQTAPDGKYQHGIRSVFAEMMATEGASALYKGSAPVLARAFPANAACFLGYEVTMRILSYF